jgi:hypothetical protein
MEPEYRSTPQRAGDVATLWFFSIVFRLAVATFKLLRSGRKSNL